MITITNDEYVENNIAYAVTRICILGISVYSKVRTTTNINVVKSFLIDKKITKVKGYKKYEDKS